MIELNKIIITAKTWDWCQIPYPNHPKGCPNYNKKAGCPTTVKMFDEIFDMDEPIYLVHSHFDLTNHIAKMLKRHPKWSDRQLRNCLYWQPKSRSDLKGKILLALMKVGLNYMSIQCPEAMGINLYATTMLNGLKLDPIKSMKICRHIALIAKMKTSLSSQPVHTVTKTEDPEEQERYGRKTERRGSWTNQDFQK